MSKGLDITLITTNNFQCQQTLISDQESINFVANEALSKQLSYQNLMLEINAI